MFGIIVLTQLFGVISLVCANYNGPFVLWGREELKNADVSSLSEIDDTFLRNIYSESPAIILFIRNSSTRLNEENFPIFKDLLQKTNYIYLTQHWLPSDPVDYNVNAEVINLVGPASQQDVEMSALFHDAVIAYGEGKVLGILATKTSDHEIRKRAAVDDASTTTTPIPFIEPDIPDEMKREDFIYYPADQTYKILLHTHSPPRLINGSSVTVLSDTKMTITTNRRNQNSQTLKVRYNSKPGLSIEYVFNITSGYWSLVSADINGTNGLDIIGEKPSAPLGFSYKCSKPLIFRNGTVFLELPNIQVQPNVKSRRFDEAYDCIGFTSAPIWSGVFVSLVICFVVAIGINCIMEIKPPNRFENSRGKQLTFTISE